MKLKTTKFREQQKIYAAPEITTVDMVADSILCSSTGWGTEALIEDETDPWA